ncbi:hypothetical protein GCM10010294_66100 [Streptomyces griseoloalbus]|nr:hypothetical protein GCM10010294_66100 [Streptomyces griseoloalbus]
MAVPRRFNLLGSGNKNAERRSSGLGALSPVDPLNHVPTHTPPAPGLPRPGSAPSPRAPGPAFSCPMPVAGRRVTPNLNPGVARQMADCVTWA